MGLNIVKQGSQMYQFINATWNPIGGKCPHGCIYCSTNKFYYPVLKAKYSGEPKLCEEMLKDNLGKGNFIFVVAQNDLFASAIPDIWIRKILKHMEGFDNKYLLQTKNPDRILNFIDCSVITDKCIVCTTIESDIFYPEIMRNAPEPMQRSLAMQEISEVIETYVTIEPIMDFNLEHMVKMIKRCNPKQVNIGFNSLHNVPLPEPDENKTIQLIMELRKFTKVILKSNSQRVIKDKSLYL